MNKTPRVINGEWGYACVEVDAVFIPAVMATADWPLRRVLSHLHKRTGMTRMIFSAILDADSFRPHLRNIVREFDLYVPEFEDYSHCIEIAYEPTQSVGAVDPHAASTGTPSTREKASSPSITNAGG